MNRCDRLGIVKTTPISEAARADLYTGLAEVLGPARAETLMAQLPRFDPSDMTTKSDLIAINADVLAVKADIAELRTEIREGLTAVHQRLDRLFITLLVGMFGAVGALISIVFTLG